MTNKRDLREVILLLSEKGFERLPGCCHNMGYAWCYEMINRKGKIPTVAKILYLREEEEERVLSITVIRTTQVSFDQIQNTDFRKESQIRTLFEKGSR